MMPKGSRIREARFLFALLLVPGLISLSGCIYPTATHEKTLAVMGVEEAEAETPDEVRAREWRVDPAEPRD